MMSTVYRGTIRKWSKLRKFLQKAHYVHQVKGLSPHVTLHVHMHIRIYLVKGFNIKYVLSNFLHKLKENKRILFLENEALVHPQNSQTGSEYELYSFHQKTVHNAHCRLEERGVVRRARSEHAQYGSPQLAWSPQRE